eukprot:4267869-Amphidinium_carterae.1
MVSSISCRGEDVRNAHPMLYQYVNHEMFCALTYFMRNPKNWALEVNTPQVVLNDGSAEDREDLRFRIGVEP